MTIANYTTEEIKNTHTHKELEPGTYDYIVDHNQKSCNLLVP